MKMYKYFSLIVILVLLIVATPTQAATMLTVDASTGTIDFGDACPSPTSSAVYKSLQAAIDCAVDGDTIEVMNGTYGVTGQTNQDGYSTAILIKNLDDLTIQAVSGHNPVVKPTTAANIVSVSIENSDRLTIDNIDSDQTIAQFDNWHVFDSNDLTVRNSRFEGGEDGIDFNTNLTTTLIENNEFVDINTGSGDEVLDFTDASYANVTIQDNLFRNNYRQITIFPPSGETATDFIIRRNFMDGTNSQEAVRLIGPDGVTLENNVIMNSSQQGLYIDSGSSNINVWQNSFFNNGFEELRTKVNTADIVIKNNIFYANGIYAALAASTSPLPGEDYNLIYNEGNSTESGSQPAVTSFGVNTITGTDPLFVSTTGGSEDLHLQFGSPAIEAGVDLGVVDDIEKNARPNPTGTAPDIGAYEAGSFDDEGPVTTNVVADPNPVAVGNSVTLTANVDDTDRGDSNIASAEYSLDGGPWTMMNASYGTFDEVSEDVTASFSAPSEPGIYDLCVRGTDDPGNEGDSECIMLVVYDPDGGFVTGGGWIDSPAGAYLPEAYHPAPETVVVTSQDIGVSWFSPDLRGGGYVDFVQGPDTPPLGIGSLEMGSTSGSDKAQLFNYGYIGTPLADIDALSYATFRYSTSTNPAAQYPSINIEVDYAGDGTSYTTLVWEPIYAFGQSALTEDTWQTWDTMALSQTSFGGGWWSTKSIPGVCAFNCFVSWDTVLQNNPNAKIVGGFGVSIGSGWNGVFTGNVDALSLTVNGDPTVYDFESVLPGPNPTGKATFGFVSKFKKGASVPTGNTEFQFKAGDLNFHSSDYDWLVVTGSNFAKFKGTGTINGEGTYKFQIWAGDGTGSNGEDEFRIKIWDASNDAVVYDNGMNQAIGGGSIVVHKK